MDLAKYKRRETQKSDRQITQKHLGNSVPVQEGSIARPVIDREMAMRMRNPHPRSNLAPVVAPSQVAPISPAALQPAPNTVNHQPIAAAPQQAAPQSAIQPVAAPAPVVTAAPVAALQDFPSQSVNPAEPAPLATKKMRLPAIDMELPGEESPSTLAAMLDGAKVKGARRWAFRGMVVGLVLFITMGGVLMSQTVINANKMFRGSAGTASALDNMNPDMLSGEGSGRINVLLLGRGGGGHTAPDLTDTIDRKSVV